MNKMMLFLFSCFFCLKVSAQISVDVFSQNESNTAGDTVSAQTGDTFSYLSQESFIEIDPMASFSRSYGVYLRGAPNSSHKYFVDGHDMEDITGIARTARMDLNISSPLDKIQISLGRKVLAPDLELPLGLSLIIAPMKIITFLGLIIILEHHLFPKKMIKNSPIE